MNKVEFLNELKQKLTGLPQEDLNDRLSFYEEIINDKIDEGKSEEEAINELGSVDKIIDDIASEIPLSKLIKEKAKPKRALKTWEIILIIIGFPIWFPLLIVGFVLCLVAIILLWTFAIVIYALELSFTISSFGSLIIYFMNLSNGESNLIYIGAFILFLGASILLFFGCIGITKLSSKLTKKIFISIKKLFIKKGK